MAVPVLGRLRCVGVCALLGLIGLACAGCASSHPQLIVAADPSADGACGCERDTAPLEIATAP